MPCLQAGDPHAAPSTSSWHTGGDGTLASAGASAGTSSTVSTRPLLRGRVGATIPAWRKDARSLVSGFAICLLGLAPWLAAPRDVNDARGLSRPDRRSSRRNDNFRPGGGRDGPASTDWAGSAGDATENDASADSFITNSGKIAGSKTFEGPVVKNSFRERVRNIEPYKDIVEQVEKGCHGRGGWQRNQIARKRMENPRPGEKKIKLTGVDNKASQLCTSACRKHRLACLHRPEDWPEPDPLFPEVAFIGRSNVGKSSLLNKVSMFGSVAAVSKMAGRTRHAVWYRNRKVRMDIIDMPGYGFAEREDMFGPDALEFVKNRTSLVCLYVLIDARHGFKMTDHEWLTALGRQGPPKQIILTKCDLVAPKKLIKVASLVRSDLEGHKRIQQKVLLASTPWGLGLHEIRKDMVLRCGKVNTDGSEGARIVETHGDFSRVESKRFKLDLMPEHKLRESGIAVPADPFDAPRRGGFQGGRSPSSRNRQLNRRPAPPPAGGRRG